MARTRKPTDGIFWKRDENKRIIYYWKIGNEKSKDFTCQTTCAMKYVERYVEKYPKYKEMVYDKTWDQIFRMFGIRIASRHPM